MKARRKSTKLVVVSGKFKDPDAQALVDELSSESLTGRVVSPSASDGLSDEQIYNIHRWDKARNQAVLRRHNHDFIEEQLSVITRALQAIRPAIARSDSVPEIDLRKMRALRSQLAGALRYAMPCDELMRMRVESWLCSLDEAMVAIAGCDRWEQNR